MCRLRPQLHERTYMELVKCIVSQCFNFEIHLPSCSSTLIENSFETVLLAFKKKLRWLTKQEGNPTMNSTQDLSCYTQGSKIRILVSRFQYPESFFFQPVCTM